MTPHIAQLSIAQIRRDSGAQYRVDGVNALHAMRLKDALELGETLPPIVVFYDGTTYWMGDGDHRIEAHLLYGLDTIQAEVRPGSQQEAQQYGRGTNAEHGLPRKNKDKKAAVLAALQDPDWDGYSVNAYAKACRVSGYTVKQVAEESGLTLKFQSQERTYIHNRSGQPTTMSTANLGRRPAEAAPERTPEPPTLETPATPPTTVPASPPQNDPRNMGAYPIDYYDEDAFSGSGYDTTDEAEPDTTPDTTTSADTVQQAAPTAPAAPVGHPGSMREVAAELEAEKRRELEARIEALPLAQALSLYAHKGHLFKEQARLWYENEKVRQVARWAASQVRMTTGPFSEAVRELARISKAEPTTWEGCPICKGSMRVGERADPCPSCKGGFTVYQGQGVSAEAVARHAREWRASQEAEAGE